MGCGCRTGATTTAPAVVYEIIVDGQVVWSATSLSEARAELANQPSTAIIRSRAAS